MSSIQSLDFNAQDLDEFEALLWREQSHDRLTAFEAHLNMDNVSWEGMMPCRAQINTESSGIDDDVKRYQAEAKECW